MSALATTYRELSHELLVEEALRLRADNALLRTRVELARGELQACAEVALGLSAAPAVAVRASIRRALDLLVAPASTVPAAADPTAPWPTHGAGLAPGQPSAMVGRDASDTA